MTDELVKVTDAGAVPIPIPLDSAAGPDTLNHSICLFISTAVLGSQEQLLPLLVHFLLLEKQILLWSH